MSEKEENTAITQLWRNTRYDSLALASFIIIAAMPVVASLWMRSYNEAESGGFVRTQVGEYKSTEPMGLFPIPVFAALHKFPDYGYCVIPADGGGFRPDWDEMTNDTQMEVCLFWIADQLGSIEATHLYFEALGYRASVVSWATIRGYEQYEKVTVGCPFHPAPCDFPETPNRYTFNISYDAGHLIGTSAHAILK